MVLMDSKRVKIIVRIGTVTYFCHSPDFFLLKKRRAEYPAPLRKIALLAEAARPLRACSLSARKLQTRG